MTCEEWHGRGREHHIIHLKTRASLSSDLRFFLRGSMTSSSPIMYKYAIHRSYMPSDASRLNVRL
jgi:hypothetical protein